MPTFSSFNAFGFEENDLAQSHIPVWLGVVSPVPVGGTLAKAYAKPGFLLGAGAPVKLADKEITPFVAWEVVSRTAGNPNDTIVIKPAVFGGATILPEAGDIIQKLGATFAATGKAGAVVSVAENATTAGQYDITLATGTIDTPSAGDLLVISASASAGSSKSIGVVPNGYLYNDIYFGNLSGDADNYTIAATGAVVMYHPEGLLVELTPSAAVKSQMAAAVPGVYQHLV